MVLILAQPHIEITWVDSDLDELNAYCLIAALTYPSPISQYQIDQVQLIRRLFPDTPLNRRRIRQLERNYIRHVKFHAVALRRFFLRTHLALVDPQTLAEEYQFHLDTITTPSWP